MNPRIHRFIERFSALKADAALVTDDVNVAYLTGFSARESWLLVTERGVFYITDARYALEAEEGLKGRGVKVVQFTDSCPKMAVVLARKCKVGVLGIDERHLTVAQYRRLQGLLPVGLRLKRMDGVVDCLRMVKDPEEISAIRESLKVNLEAFRYIKERIRAGRTERDLFLDLDRFVRRRGVEFSFPPIIASGPNSARPHARVTGRKLLGNEPVLIDCGIEKNGYKSDLTRMFFLGKITPSFQDALSSVREAQEEAIKLIKPGVSARAVDAIARKCLKRRGNLDRFFTHSLGHGVGLDIHEEPRISYKSGVILSENMIFTIEPGVYIKNRYGIRLEEMVRVTHSACEVLSVNHN